MTDVLTGRCREFAAGVSEYWNANAYTLPSGFPETFAVGEYGSLRKRAQD